MSRSIWENLELVYKEYYVYDVIIKFLEKYDFFVEKYYKLDIVFCVEFLIFDFKNKFWVVVICEYDVFLGIGYVCGYNFIVEIGVVVGIVIKYVMMLGGEILIG